MKINDINVIFLFNSERFFIFHLHNDLFPDSFMKCFLLGGMINGQTFGLNTEKAYLIDYISEIFLVEMLQWLLLKQRCFILKSLVHMSRSYCWT